MIQSTFRVPQKQYVAIGDRIVIRSCRQAMAIFVGKPGTVVAVFDVPRGSCMVRMGTEDEQSEQFLYGNEVYADTPR